MNHHSALLEQLSRTALLYLLVILATSVALLYQSIPPWVSGFALICVCWRLLIFVGKLSFPSVWLKTALVFLSMVGAFLQYRYNLSLDVFVTILTLGFALKLLEVYHKKNAQLLLYLAFFVLMTYLLYEQTLAAGLLAIIQVMLIVSGLIAVNSDARELDVHYWQPLKKSSLVLLIALPLMSIIFLFMPRLSPLWIMPLQTQHAKTGMSEEMSPGDITRLANSTDLVFRATFSGKMPPKHELYWQAFVFDEFDGRQWKNNCECNYTWTNTNRTSPPEPIQNRLWHYQIILEPHGQRWVFALPNSYIQNDKITTNGDDLFRYRKNMVDKSVYESSVFKKTLDKSLSKVELKRYTQLPTGNLQARELANKWRKQYQSNSQIIQAALTFYGDSLQYTLTPPALGANSIDDFLFVTKAGFCEHFASSFVFLMRAANIPARVVLGYQGGEINEQGNYVIVRQYDAHAWTEVWLSEQGWVRVDPTNTVDPQRISAGFETAFANSTVFKSPLSLNAYRRINIINWIRIKLDYVDYAWSRWVIGYNADVQRGLFFALGLTSSLTILLWFGIGSAIFFVGFFLFLMLRDRLQQNEHPLTRQYRQLSSAYEFFGLIRQLSETPLQFAGRVKYHQLPYNKQFFMITRQYNHWICGEYFTLKSQCLLRFQCVYWYLRLKVLRICSVFKRG